MSIYLTDSDLLNESNIPKGDTPKTLSASYLYGKVDTYETNLIKFIMEAERIDTNSEMFADLLYDIKRRAINNSLLKVLTSKNIVLCRSDNPLSIAFKVFTAKDLKDKNKNTKVFVDVSKIIYVSNGIYTCDIKNVDIIISYLVSAACQRIYYGATDKFTRNTTIISTGSEIFAQLMNYTIDYLYKINTMPIQKQKLEYLSSMYYQICILGKDPDDRAKQIAIKQSKISEREAQIIDIQTPSDSYLNINMFIQAIAKILRIDKLTLDVFMNKWVYLFGPGTQFAVEMFYAFSDMITNAYVGAYINSQKTIEKITGRRMVEFATKIIEIESNVLNG